MNKVLWFSRHPMTEEQKASLGECEITQVNKSIRSAKELEQEISENDIIAIVAPPDLQKQFVELANGKPVITAVSERVLIPQPDGTEDKVAFQFKKWEQIKKFDIEKKTFDMDEYKEENSLRPIFGDSKDDRTKVLWFSRHPMSEEQEASLGDCKITQINKSINSAYELKEEIDNNDIIAIVAPPELQKQFIDLADGKPVIMAVNDRVLVPQPDGSEDKVEFHFNRWEQFTKFDIEKEDFILGKENNASIKDEKDDFDER